MTGLLDLTRRLADLEQAAREHRPETEIDYMTDAKLERLIARSTGLTAGQVHDLSDDDLDRIARGEWVAPRGPKSRR